MRKLSPKEVNVILQKYPQASKMDVERFLMVGLGGCHNTYTAGAHLEMDAKIAGWNEQTISAIQYGIGISDGVLPGLAVIPNESIDPLERQISDLWSYKSFDEAIQQIEQKTGFEVSCPQYISTFFHQIEVQAHASSDPPHYKKPENTIPKSLTVKDFVDLVCRNLNLTWKLDQPTKTIALDLPWKISDPRPASKLMDFLEREPWRSKRWQTAFNALLSKDVNFEKAYKVRQRAIFEESGSLGEFVGNPIVNGQIISTSKARYIFILISYPYYLLKPGGGSVAYYWFKYDGTLAGADLMNTGFACGFVGATMDNKRGGHSAQASELHIVLSQELSRAVTMTATFVLEEDGLKLIHLLDEHDKEVNNQMNIGQSFKPM